MHLIRFFGPLLLVVVLAYPDAAFADEPGSFGPTIRGADDAPEEDVAELDAAHRGARHGVQLLHNRARRAAQNGDHDHAIALYENLLTHRWTPRSFAVAAAAEKALVEVRDGRLDDALATVDRADRAAHDAESVPLWRTVRYLRTAVLATDDNLAGALEFFACDDIPHGPAEQLLCDIGPDASFDPDSFLDEALTTALYYPPIEDGTDADRVGLSLVVQPLLHAIYRGESTPRQTLSEDSVVSLDERLHQAYRGLVEIYRDNDDPTAEFRVHLTRANLPIDIDRAQRHLARAEQLYDYVEKNTFVEHDIAWTRARLCLATQSPDDCRPEIDEVAASTGVSTLPNRRDDYGALCRPELGDAAHSFCRLAADYFAERGDNLAKSIVVSRHLAISDDHPDDERRALLDELDSLIDDVVLTDIAIHQRRAIYRHRCRASIDIDARKAPASCRELVDLYRSIPADDFGDTELSNLLDDLLLEADARRRTGADGKAVDILDLVVALATTGDRSLQTPTIDRICHQLGELSSADLDDRRADIYRRLVAQLDHQLADRDHHRCLQKLPDS